MKDILFEPIGQHLSYLQDESRLKGKAGTIAFPEEEDAVVRLLKTGRKLTIQGGMTGISGGAVPQEGEIINLSRMNRVEEFFFSPEWNSWCVRLQPGVLLRDLRLLLNGKKQENSIPGYDKLKSAGKWFFPPDPTEVTASLGGMAACNASGARGFYYGPIRPYVTGMRVALPGGITLALERGREKLQGLSLPCPPWGALPLLKEYGVKNCAGYYLRKDMDLLDLFIGAEGGLGIITELTLKICPHPPAIWGIILFLPHEEGALALKEGLGKSPVALEFFDRNSLSLLKRLKEKPAFSSLPPIPEEAGCALFLEFHGKEEELDKKLEKVLDLLKSADGDEEYSWLADTPRELTAQKFFRHALPEGVNLRIDELRKKSPEVIKLGTDMAVPGDKLPALLARYHRDLKAEGLEYVIFGHMGENHLHVNILSRDPGEYARGLKICDVWAEEVLQAGGTIAAEHGTGKLKNNLLLRMFGPRGIEELKKIKHLFDPRGELNPGNWWR